MLKIINTAVLIVAVCSSLVHAETRSEKRANDVKARKEVASQLDRTAQTIKNNLQPIKNNLQQSALTTQSDFTTIQAEVHKQKAQVKDMKTKILLKTAAPTNTDCWHAIVAKVNKYDASPELKAQYAQRMYMQLATVTKGDGGYKALKGS
jgi:hypothetical protein